MSGDTFARASSSFATITAFAVAAKGDGIIMLSMGAVACALTIYCIWTTPEVK